MSQLILKDKQMSQLVQIDPSISYNVTPVDKNDNQQKLANYPPFNIIKYHNKKYEIQIAITGFDKNDLRIEVKDSILTVIGSSKSKKDDLNYIYRGLSTRDFHRQFNLMEYTEVSGAVIKNGMLIIELLRNIPDIDTQVIDIIEI
jgi:HSP20 family molecular chaperone IbpA